MSLDHKDYTLPDVDLSHDDGDPRWHEAQQLPATGAMGSTPLYNEQGEVYAYQWNGLAPGHYREYWRLCVEEDWAERVNGYEENPDDVWAAYWYVDHHPVFWAFERERNNDYPPNHVSRLEHEGALMHRSWPEITPHKDDQGLVWGYEFGKRGLFPNEHGFHTTWHDTDLDGYADTYEAAVIAVAMKIWDKYGNDRRIVDSEEWVKDDCDKEKET